MKEQRERNQITIAVCAFIIGASFTNAYGIPNALAVPLVALGAWIFHRAISSDWPE